MQIYLRDVGVMAVEPAPSVSAVEALVAEYREWLVADRGLAAMTVLRYETLARRFLTARVTPTDELGVADLDGAVVSRFLLRECGRVCLGSAKGKVAELRSLLRFLHVRGFTPRSLAESVPGVAGWRETTIPPTMPQSDIEALLASCDRLTLDGARDHAMLMLLARLGLRSIEIARLQLQDLDWRAGDLLVRGKARRDDRLPIPDDVGTALAKYLAARGRHDSRSVFLTLRAPIRPIRADLVGDVVQRHCRQAGVPHVGPHRLRHTLRPGCSPAARRWRTSARCCATAIWRRPRSTRRSISAACGRSRGRGPGRHDDPPGGAPPRVLAAPPGSWSQARRGASAAAAVRDLS
jgi:integrase